MHQAIYFKNAGEGVGHCCKTRGAEQKPCIITDVGHVIFGHIFCVKWYVSFDFMLASKNGKCFNSRSTNLDLSV